MTSNRVAGSPPPPPPLEPWHRLDNKVVLVTGASSGLGREMCLDLAKAGCKVIAAARRLDRLTALCEQINKSSPDSAVRAVALELDVTADGATIEAAVHRAWEAFGHIDALINNAGIRGEVASPLDLSEEEWDRVVRTNQTGPWVVAKYIGRRMRDSGRGGSIINVSSIASLNRVILPGIVAYGSSKAGLDNVTKVMALELGEFNIRVNSIASGIFSSEITDGLFKMDGLKRVVKRTIPLGTLGTSDPALTSLTRYLIHDSSSYVSGNIFIPDAGTTLVAFPIFSSL